MFQIPLVINTFQSEFVEFYFIFCFVFIGFSVPIYLSVCLSVGLFACLSVCQSVCLLVHLLKKNMCVCARVVNYNFSMTLLYCNPILKMNPER